MTYDFLKLHKSEIVLNFLGNKTGYRKKSKNSALGIILAPMRCK